MTGLLASDLLILLSLDDKGKLKREGRYKTGLVCSLIADLINLGRLNLKTRDDNQIFIKAVKGEVIGNKILDEIYITIRDCPKEYTINEWVFRFVESYDVYEELMIESMIHREILLTETKSERFGRMFIAALLFIPCLLPGAIYYTTIAKQIHYKVKTPNLKKDSEQQLIRNLKSLNMPDPSYVGLIIILKTTYLFSVAIDKNIDDYLTKKFYQLQDHDFLNPDMNLLVKYLKDRYEGRPKTDTSLFTLQSPTTIEDV